MLRFFINTHIIICIICEDEYLSSSWSKCYRLVVQAETECGFFTKCFLYECLYTFRPFIFMMGGDGMTTECVAGRWRGGGGGRGREGRGVGSCICICYRVLDIVVVRVRCICEVKLFSIIKLQTEFEFYHLSSVLRVLVGLLTGYSIYFIISFL